MKFDIKKVFITLGGYTFWSLLILWGLLSLLLKGCESLCYYEVVQTAVSPNGEQVAEIYIGDCGGATTDFYGGVNVISDNPNLGAEQLYTFTGRPQDTGLEVYWVSDTELVISISDLYKARRINPGGRKSSELTVNYDFRQ